MAARVTGGSGSGSLPLGSAADIGRSDGNATSVTGVTEDEMAHSPVGTAAAMRGTWGMATTARRAISRTLVHRRALRGMAGS